MHLTNKQDYEQRVKLTNNLVKKNNPTNNTYWFLSTKALGSKMNSLEEILWENGRMLKKLEDS